MYIFSSRASRRLASLLVLVALVGPIAADPVVAQAAGNAVETPEEPEAHRSLPGGLEIVEAEYVDETVEVTLRATETQAVSVVGARAEEGAMDKSSVALSEGETATISVQAGIRRGTTAVTIRNDRVSYYYPFDVSTSWIGGPWTAQDAQIAALAGASSVAIVAIFLTFRAITGRADAPERVA